MRDSWNDRFVLAEDGALGMKRAVLKDLNEQSEQQGSEGLERFRAAFTVSYSTRR